jgi:hypothetical protein
MWSPLVITDVGLQLAELTDYISDDYEHHHKCSHPKARVCRGPKVCLHHPHSAAATAAAERVYLPGYRGFGGAE